MDIIKIDDFIINVNGYKIKINGAQAKRIHKSRYGHTDFSNQYRFIFNTPFESILDGVKLELKGRTRKDAIKDAIIHNITNNKYTICDICDIILFFKHNIKYICNFYYHLNNSVSLKCYIKEMHSLNEVTSCVFIKCYEKHQYAIKDLIESLPREYIDITLLLFNMPIPEDVIRIIMKQIFLV